MYFMGHELAAMVILVYKYPNNISTFDDKEVIMFSTYISTILVLKVTASSQDSEPLWEGWADVVQQMLCRMSTLIWNLTKESKKNRTVFKYAIATLKLDTQVRMHKIWKEFIRVSIKYIRGETY